MEGVALRKGADMTIGRAPRVTENQGVLLLSAHRRAVRVHLLKSLRNILLSPHSPGMWKRLRNWIEDRRRERARRDQEAMDDPNSHHGPVCGRRRGKSGSIRRWTAR
jgi:hypothetical protein